MTTKQAKRPRGRPSEYNQYVADEICNRIANGESLRKILSDPKCDWMPSTPTVFRWIEGNEDFRKQYEFARQIQAEAFADDIVSIADGSDAENAEERVSTTQRDRLRVDARKWAASELLPKKYGDKIEHGGNLGVTLVMGDLDDKL